MERVVINEPTEAENLSLEQQAAMQEEAAKQKQAQAEEAKAIKEQTNELTQERPEWLDEKFKSAEDLAKAYRELEAKQSTNNQETDKAESEPKGEDKATNNNINSVIEEATESFYETGELSDKMYAKLAKVGIPSEYVNAYIEGQQSMALSQTLEVQETVGGRANYEAMTDWASENLSDSDVDAYNAIVESGTIDQAKMAVQGMYARFISSGGKAPNLTQGSTSGDSVKPFNSAAQVTEAMRDARYKSDPAFRATVEKRLAVSNIL